MFQLSSNFLRLKIIGVFTGLLIIGFIGCAPTDQHVRSYQERLNTGNPIIYNRSGEINLGCNRAWSDLTLNEKEIADLYFLKVMMTPGFGANNCFKVGDRVQVKSAESRKLTDTYVEIGSVYIWKSDAPKAKKEFKEYFKLDFLDYSGTAKDKKIVTDYAANLFNSNVMGKARDSFDGVINVTTVRISSSAPNASDLLQKGRRNFESSFSEETAETGETLPSCGSLKFLDYRTSRETWELMNSGKTLTAWDIHPGRLCVGQDSVIDVTNHQKNASGEYEFFGKIKIGKMRRMQIDQFSKDYVTPGSMSSEEIEKEIRSQYREKAKDPKVRLFLFNFEILSGEVE